MFDLDIHPLKGVGPLEFGMDYHHVASLLGAPDDTELDDETGELREFRRGNGLHAVYGEEGAYLVELGFSRNISELTFHDQSLFLLPEKQVVHVLVDADGDPQFVLGFIVLLRLGITLTGFHEEDKQKQAVTVFSNGRWDSMKSSMRRFDVSLIK